MKQFEALAKTWNEVESDIRAVKGWYQRRLSCHGPSAVYAGLRHPEKYRRITFEIPMDALGRLKLKDESKGYAVDVELQNELGIACANIHVRENDLITKDIFPILCKDLLYHFCLKTNAADGIQSVSRRLGHWKRFFQNRLHGSLTREEYIGLAGEVFFLELLFISGINALQAVEAWNGPLGSNQDFLFGPVAVEVKATVGNTPDLVHIAGTRQLDNLGLLGLFLFNAAFDFREAVGITLENRITKIRELLSKFPEAAGLFEDRLLCTGYATPDVTPWAAYGFTVRSTETFRVGEGFPCLTEQSIPHAILDLEYKLDLAACREFKVSTDNCIELITNGLKNV